MDGVTSWAKGDDPVADWLADPNEATSEGLSRLQRAAQRLREEQWPLPYRHTKHWAYRADARKLTNVFDGLVDLVVTSPPYWTLKDYNADGAQLGAIENYEEFLAELQTVFDQCASVLRPGGRLCINVGDVCLSRKAAGRHYVMPLHADIQVMARRIGLDCLTPIIWQKIANGRNEVNRGSSGFYGKPFQPGAIVKNDVEYVLFLRKPGGYRKPTPMQKALSVLTQEQMRQWWRSTWSDIKGASTRGGHPAPFPVSLAERLIRMFSFAGDIVMDPFAGSGTTGVAAMNSGRSSVQIEVSNEYFRLMKLRLDAHAAKISAFQTHRIYHD